MTASQIRAHLQLPVSVQRVRQILHEDPNTVWKKRKPKPKLTARHKEVRLQFAKEQMSWQEVWHQVLFSDEKEVRSRWSRWLSILLARSSKRERNSDES